MICLDSESKKGYLLLKPKILINSDQIAKIIATCKGVREVFLTSGDYGFIATIELKKNHNIQKIVQSVKKASGCVVINTAFKHYIYRRE